MMKGSGGTEQFWKYVACLHLSSLKGQFGMLPTRTYSPDSITELKGTQMASSGAEIEQISLLRVRR